MEGPAESEVRLPALNRRSGVMALFFGTSFPLVRGFAVAGCLSWTQHAGIPPRRAGNFLLGAQKKVTKEEGLNAQL